MGVFVQSHEAELRRMVETLHQGGMVYFGECGEIDVADSGNRCLYSIGN
jgi:hypothetical protein